MNYGAEEVLPGMGHFMAILKEALEYENRALRV
jgi:hypothetical protein